MEAIGATAVASLGGGVMGALIKIVAGLFQVWLRNRQEDRLERANLADKQIDILKMRPDPDSHAVSTTRRVLAWGVCGTFCAICLLWAVFPGYPILADGGDQGTQLNLLIFNYNFSRDLGIYLTTGAIVWQLTPFVSMVLMTYFTPDISKVR